VLARRNHFVIISPQEVFHLAVSCPLQHNATFTVATMDARDELVPVRIGRDRCKKRGPSQGLNRSMRNRARNLCEFVAIRHSLAFCSSLILSLIPWVALILDLCRWTYTADCSNQISDLTDISFNLFSILFSNL
jgi:hypothetical protein